MNQKLIAKILSGWSVDFKFASNGLEAIELVSLENFDLILMDIEMPEKTGHEVTAFIRNESDKNKHTPIIGLSAHGTESERRKSIKWGMDDYMIKPFRQNDLKAKILSNIFKGSEQASSKLKSSALLEEDIHLTYLKRFYEDNIATYLWNVKVAIDRQCIESIRSSLLMIDGFVKNYSLSSELKENIENLMDLIEVDQPDYKAIKERYAHLVEMMNTVFN